jgi:hypothetical protein
VGRKPARKGKYIHLSIAGLIFLSPFGCTTVEKTTIQVEVSTATAEAKGMTRTGTPFPETRKRQEMNAVAPEGSKEKEKAREDVNTNEHLFHGQELFIQGDYDGSLKEYRKVLALSANGPPGDEALFHIGLIYAHHRNPKRDLAMSLSFFGKLIKDYPQSPWAEQAKIWTEVLRENETLKKVIEESKQVDIEIEEKKREKAR